jgi:hypothetical protein
MFRSKTFSLNKSMDKKLFKIELLAFKSSGKYYSEYDLEGDLRYLSQNEDCPYTPDVIDLVNAAKNDGRISREFDYLIQTGVPHFIKAN